jgi:hypothetical protein
MKTWQTRSHHYFIFGIWHLAKNNLGSTKNKVIFGGFQVAKICEKIL